MPSTVRELAAGVGLQLKGCVPWSVPIPSSLQGVYFVSLSPHSDQIVNLHSVAPISSTAVRDWVARVPRMELDGKRATGEGLIERLSSFWLPDECVVYIGKATSLRSRINGYYRTPLGDRRPHAGGHWIKTLSCLKECFVHFAETPQPEDAEAALLDAFVSKVSPVTRAGIKDSANPFPFANLEFPPGTRKAHGIGKSKIA